MKRYQVTKLTGLTAAIIFSTTSWAEKMEPFETLDRNQDGRLTPSEVSQSPQLVLQWGAIDQDDSGALDRQEFSAFEEKQTADSGKMESEQQHSGQESAATPEETAATAQAMQQQKSRIDHPLYSMSPEELEDQDVHGSDGRKLGEISKVVSDRQSGRIHIVISHGGFMGLAASRHAFPLDDLQMKEGNLHLPITAQELDARRKYSEDAYVTVEPEDRPISEFAAFEEEPIAGDKALRPPSDQDEESDD